MSDYDITAANSVFTITVPGLYNAPITLENYATDRVFETEAVEQAETAMSIDGYLNAGWVPNPIAQTISLAAASSSSRIFEAIVAAQATARSLYRLSAEIQLPSIGKKYTMVRGLVRSAVVIPSAARVLEMQTFELLWERVIPAAL